MKICPDRAVAPISHLLDEPVPDSFQAYLVEGAYFTENEEYPIIPPEMVYQEVPERILPFQKAWNSKEDLSSTFICFYSPDAEFERVRRNPKQYLPFFRRTAGIIGFDYSIHEDMPLIKQKSQINDNLALTFFFGRNGIPVIPNVRCGADDLLDEFLTAIPRNTSIAVGTHGFIKYRQMKFDWFCYLMKICDILSPKRIIVYGGLNGEIFDEVKQRTEVTCFPSWFANDMNRRYGHVK